MLLYALFNNISTVNKWKQHQSTLDYFYFDKIYRVPLLLVLLGTNNIPVTNSKIRWRQGRYMVSSGDKFYMVYLLPTGWPKKVSCWFYADLSMKTQKIGGTWTNTNNYRENEALSDIFRWNILSVFSKFKYSITTRTTIIAKQTRMSFAKFRKTPKLIRHVLRYSEPQLEDAFAIRLRSCWSCYLLILLRQMVLLCWNMHQSIQLTFLSHLVLLPNANVIGIAECYSKHYTLFLLVVSEMSRRKFFSCSPKVHR